MKIATFFGIVFCFTASYLLAEDSAQPRMTRLVPIPMEYQIQAARSNSVKPILVQSYRVFKPMQKTQASPGQTVKSHVGAPNTVHLVLKDSISQSHGTHEIPVPYLRHVNVGQMHPAPKRSPLRTRFSMIDSSTIYR